MAAGTPAHAYLFTGPRGTGKTSTARIVAKGGVALDPRGDRYSEESIGDRLALRDIYRSLAAEGIGADVADRIERRRREGVERRRIEGRRQRDGQAHLAAAPMQAGRRRPRCLVQ